MIRLIIAALAGLLISACTSHPVSEALQSDYPAMGTSKYNKLMRTYSAEDKKYQFLDNNYIVSSTILNSKVKKAILLRKSHALQASVEKVKKQEQEMLERAASKTEFFVSFFSPIEKQALLNSSDLWQLYLESKGKRYAGVVKKVKGATAVTNSLYFYHNRFSKPYIIEFDIPLSEVENDESYLIITGTLGSSKLKFKALN